MDHVLEKIADYFEIYMDDFIQEHITKGHRRLTDNSYYTEVKTLIESMKPLRRLLNMPPLRLKDEVRNRINEAGGKQ